MVIITPQMKVTIARRADSGCGIVFDMAIHETYQGPAMQFAGQNADPRVRLIAAIGRNRELGKEGKLLWSIPDDLKRFRMLTKGHPVIMGRKTFESILSYTGGKPLPERTNIVVTRDISYTHDDATVVHSLEDALVAARNGYPEAIDVIGGAQIYTEALPYADELLLTLIDDEKEADSFFPRYEESFTKIKKEEAGEYEGLKYKWVDLER